MTIDEAIAVVKQIALGRTRYDGQEPFVDEVLVAEIERLRKIVTSLRAEKRYQLVREEQELLMGRWTKEESDKHLTGFDAETEKMVHGAASAAGGEEEKVTG